MDFAGGGHQVRRDGVLESGVGIRSDQPDPGQAAGDQVGEELVPGRTRFAGGHPQAEDLAVAVAVDAGGNSTTALTTRPPSRTFIVSASAATNVNGPAWPRGRWRKASTCSSSSVAIRETWDLDRALMPRVLTSLGVPPAAIIAKRAAGEPSGGCSPRPGSSLLPR